MKGCTAYGIAKKRPLCTHLCYCVVNSLLHNRTKKHVVLCTTLLILQSCGVWFCIVSCTIELVYVLTFFEGRSCVVLYWVLTCTVKYRVVYSTHSSTTQIREKHLLWRVAQHKVLHCKESTTGQRKALNSRLLCTRLLEGRSKNKTKLRFVVHFSALCSCFTPSQTSTQTCTVPGKTRLYYIILALYCSIHYTLR